MADKQYTFRTTKSTEWLEEVLDQIETGRSALIRELLITGLEVHGIVADYNTQRRHNLLHKLDNIDAHSPIIKKLSQSLPQNVGDIRDNVTHFVGEVSENIPQNSHTKEPSTSHTQSPVIEDEGNLFEVKQTEIKDLDGALNSLDFDNLNFE